MVAVHPNPVSSYLQVAYTAKQAGVQLFSIQDLTGRVLQAKQFSLLEGHNQVRLDVSGFPAGVYLLSLDGVSDAIPFVVE